MTTYFRFSNRRTQLVWWGKMPVWSMSGLVTTMCPAWRMWGRRVAGVSPSYT